MRNEMDIQQKVKEIKQSFRLAMDGATAQSMRQKGLSYRLNWGVTLPRLRQMADELAADMKGDAEEADSTIPTGGDSAVANQDGPAVATQSSRSYALALALWKEDVRECKILATMLMPPDEMLPEVADIWMEQIATVEVAEQAAFNLFQHLPYAADKAFLWIAAQDELPQICGYHVLSRLFMQRQEPNERAINEFIDQALAALQSTNPALRKAAMQSVIHFAGMGLMYERVARSAIHSIHLDFL